jgi:hypothetical protein
MKDQKTFIEKMNRNPELLKAIVSMPDRVNKQMAETRREKNFSFLWQDLDMEEQEVLNLVKQREEEFISDYGNDVVPEWMLRCEAQDILMEFMYERFEEENLL